MCAPNHKNTRALPGEKYGFISMDQDAVFQVVAQSPGEDIVLNILAKANHVLDGIAVADADDILLDDGPGIQLFGDIVTFFQEPADRQEWRTPIS